MCPGGSSSRSRQVWLLCVQYFCLSYGWYFYITWLPTYLQEARHLNLTIGGVLRHRAAVLGGLGNPASVFVARQPLRAALGSMAQTRRIMAYIGFAGASGFPDALHAAERSADGDARHRHGQFLATTW